MSELENNQQREQWLQNINHDLRAPLGNIRSATSILLQNLSDPLTDDQRVFIEIIEHAATRLIDQSNRLMLFGQIAYTTVNLESTKLSELFAQVKQTLKNNYEIDAITLEADGDPIINCNPQTLAATLAMMAAGNVKYQPNQTNNPPEIYAQIKEAEIRFTIHSQMQARELDPSLVDLSREIIQRHGGALTPSESDGRKQFTFSLPLPKAN